MCHSLGHTAPTSATMQHIHQDLKKIWIGNPGILLHAQSLCFIFSTYQCWRILIWPKGFRNRPMTYRNPSFRVRSDIDKFVTAVPRLGSKGSGYLHLPIYRRERLWVKKVLKLKNSIWYLLWRVKDLYSQESPSCS